MFKFLLFSLVTTIVYSANQTSNITTPLPEDSLPYRVKLERASFSLPNGLHSFVFATYNGEWLLLSGRTNGLHDVDTTDPSDNSFPVSAQNKMVYVVNPNTGAIVSRSLLDATAHLSQKQIDLLSVTNALSYQAHNGKILYMVGGYGIDTKTGLMGTKDALTAIDVPDLMKWVKGNTSKTAAQCMRQVFDPILQVTGGVMWQTHGHNPSLLAFGQNFDGNYTASSNGYYTQQVRPFRIVDTGTSLFIQPYKQPKPLAVYRRRDLNVVPIIKKVGKSYINAFSTLSGVFTVGDDDNPGAWTVPIEIYEDGSSFMFDPASPTTLAQGMNNYSCPNVGLYSKKTNDMYTILFGGISYMIVSDGNQSSCTAAPPPDGDILTPCDNLPFVNDITTIRINPKGEYSQYLMSEKFPTIIADYGTSPGGPIWFGASAAFLPIDRLPYFPNNVISLDKLGSSPVQLGWIVGGIASSVTDTNDPSDSQASTYIFTVTLEPR